MTLDEYYSCLMLILLRSVAIDNSSGTNPVVVHGLFNPLETVDSLKPALHQMMKLRSQSVSELSASLLRGRTTADESGLWPFEHGVVRNRPIFRIRDDLAIVMDPVFLGAMATEGPLFMADDVDEALRVFGLAFEAYGSQVLKNIYPESPGLTRRFTSSPIGAGDSGAQVQLADGFLDCGDKTVLFEAKAVRIREDKIESSAEDYVAFLRKKYVNAGAEGQGVQRKGVAQLANSICKLADGEWKPGPDASLCSRIVPVLLVHDSLIDAPLHPWFLAREFAMLLEPSGTDWNGQQIRVAHFVISNLIVITIDDLEALESSTQYFGLCELLQDYSAAFPDRMDSLHNYIVADRKYGNAIVYNERVRSAFSRELRNLEAALGPA